jgi:hypothetical protein
MALFEPVPVQIPRRFRQYPRSRQPLGQKRFSIFSRTTIYRGRGSLSFTLDDGIMQKSLKEGGPEKLRVSSLIISCAERFVQIRPYVWKTTPFACLYKIGKSFRS